MAAHGVHTAPRSREERSPGAISGARQLLAGALRKRCLAAMSTLLELFRSYTAAKRFSLPAKGAIGECVKSASRCKKPEVKRARDERTAPREAPGVGASAAGRLAPLLGLTFTLNVRLVLLKIPNHWKCTEFLSVN